jgi:HSP20 family protein
MTENTAVQCCSENGAAKTAPAARTFTPRVDIVETESALFVHTDLPGVRPEDVDLRFEQGELTLVGKVHPRTTPGRLIFGEYEVGDFQRSFQVPESIDASRIDAEFKNGVLTIRLPKPEAAKPKQVAIKVQA